MKKEQIMKPELVKCPVCNESLFFMEFNKNEGCYEITCSSCGTTIRNDNAAGSIKGWNRRAADNEDCEED